MISAVGLDALRDRSWDFCMAVLGPSRQQCVRLQSAMTGRSTSPTKSIRSGNQPRYEVNRASAYAALSDELEACRRLPRPMLVELIGSKPASKVIVVDGEELLLEVQAAWASAKRMSVRVTAIAYGPSHLQTERLEEHLTIPISDAGDIAR